MRNRKLRLAKETLSVLDTAQLGSVVAGQSDPCIVCRYTYCLECVNDWSFEFCPTLPVEECI